MYSDLNSYLLLNKKLVRIFGADLALYWSVLSDIIGKVLEKKDRKPLVDGEGYFTVDRDYISLETGLSLEQQFNCDSILVRAGVLVVGSDRNKLQPDLKNMVEIIVSDDTKFLQTLSKKAILPKGITEKNANAAKRAEELVTKEKAKEMKTFGQRVGMYKIADKHEISKQEGLVDKLHGWIDSVYERGLFLNGAFVNTMCDAICAYSTDPKVREGLVNTAAMYGYREFNYVLDVYLKSEYKTSCPSAANTQAKQRIATRTDGIYSETFQKLFNDYQLN